MNTLGNLIYTPETASGEAIGKVESHTPRIVAPDVVKVDQPSEVKVTVGPHPNTLEHSIRRIEVYFYEDERSFNPIVLTAMCLTPAYSEPSIVLTTRLKKSGTIYAIGYCNLHGLWEGRKEIKVE
ncbi:MAG: class II SORL domain-containing protein [Candidatus Bathyarchaeota archaeon]